MVFVSVFVCITLNYYKTNKMVKRFSRAFASPTVNVNHAFLAVLEAQGWLVTAHIKVHGKTPVDFQRSRIRLHRPRFCPISLGINLEADQ